WLPAALRRAVFWRGTTGNERHPDWRTTLTLVRTRCNLLVRTSLRCWLQFRRRGTTPQVPPTRGPCGGGDVKGRRLHAARAVSGLAAVLTLGRSPRDRSTGAPVIGLHPVHDTREGWERRSASDA